MSFIPVESSNEAFEIKRIFCVGRNYAAHAREMGENPDRDPPFFFTKFSDAYVGNGSIIPYPSRTANYHHEIELAVAICRSGAMIAEANATSYIFGYATALDMTRRDLQLEARDKGRPWDTGKNFPLSVPCTSLKRIDDVGELTSGSITLDVNGERRQEADLADLIWSVKEVISDLSTYYELQRGDLILTGTPAGVGPVKIGDELVGRIHGLPDLKIKIGDAL